MSSSQSLCLVELHNSPTYSTQNDLAIDTLQHGLRSFGGLKQQLNASFVIYSNNLVYYQSSTRVGLVANNFHDESYLLANRNDGGAQMNFHDGFLQISQIRLIEGQFFHTTIEALMVWLVVSRVWMLWSRWC